MKAQFLGKKLLRDVCDIFGFQTKVWELGSCHLETPHCPQRTSLGGMAQAQSACPASTNPSTDKNNKQQQKTQKFFSPELLYWLV
jgi:hypothetical protein